MSAISKIESGDHASVPLHHVALLSLALIGMLVAMFFWYTGAINSVVWPQIYLLLGLLLLLNVAPVLTDLHRRHLNWIAPRYIFLAYFFLIFTFQCYYRILWDSGLDRGHAMPEPSLNITVRALGAILLSLSAFILGCYLPLGRVLGRTLPNLPSPHPARIVVTAIGGLFCGVLAFWLLMRSAGGIYSFLANLESWRTTGVIAGVGYLTFPITVVLPAASLLLVLHRLARRPNALERSMLLAGYGITLLPLIVLGFRISLMPALLQLFAAWHFAYRRLQFGQLAVTGLCLLTLLSFYGVVRGTLSGAEQPPKDAWLNAVIFRVPGLDTVERVLWQLEKGEPHRAPVNVLAEAGTVLIPRTLWSGKPEPGNLTFADTFFYDYFLWRGDPLDGVKSGISPTLVGELLWIGGLFAVGLGAWLLGLLAASIESWRAKNAHNTLHRFAACVSFGCFAIFVEAPQNSLNSFVMLLTFSFLLFFLMTFGSRNRSPRSLTC